MLIIGAFAPHGGATEEADYLFVRAVGRIPRNNSQSITGDICGRTRVRAGFPGRKGFVMMLDPVVVSKHRARMFPVLGIIRKICAIRLTGLLKVYAAGPIQTNQQDGEDCDIDDNKF